jgi:hypothetical protein
MATEISQPSRSHSFAWPLVAALIAVLVFIAFMVRKHAPEGDQAIVPDQRFTSLRITGTFISAIPTMTRELNLEVATSRQTETFERSEAKSLFGWLDLGTNTASIRVPVTYRYHLRLCDAWHLHVEGQTVIVRAPLLRASQPPAIHTEGMEQQSSRGWCRLPPDDLVSRLLRDLTPELSAMAEDPRRLALVRETCRQSVAEFIRRWLAGEAKWHAGAFTSIKVQFADERTMPTKTALKLLQP